MDDLGRLVDRGGEPVDDDGEPLTDPDGRPLPRASRTPVCKVVAKEFELARRSTAPGTAAAAARSASSWTAAPTPAGASTATAR